MTRLPRASGAEDPLPQGGRRGASRVTAVLVALSVLFLAALAVQRHRSTFLAVEAAAASARAVASARGLSVVEVLALHDAAGGRLSKEALDRLAGAFVRCRRELGDDGLAVLAATGQERLVRDLHRQTGGDPERALARLHGQPQELVVWRFHKMIERFASRERARR